MTQFRVEDAIRTAVVEMGATVIRGHTLGISVGNPLSYESDLNIFTQSGIDAIDQAIYIAKQYPVRLIIPLIDNYHYYHGGELTFTNWRGSDNQEDFYTNNIIINDFKGYISKLLNHVNKYTGVALKDEPMIMAWESGNELGNPMMPTSWTLDICEYIKNITDNQLFLDGRYGLNNDELNMDCIDIVSDHYYPMNNDKLSSDAHNAYNHNKVFIAGEFGWSDGGSSLDSFLNTILNSSTNMDCYWSLFPHNDTFGFEYHNDGFSLYYPGNQPGNDQSNNVQLLRKHAYLMAGITNIPQHASCQPPLITQFICGNNPNQNITSECRNQRIIYWRGGSACSQYSMYYNTISPNESDPNWVLISKTLNDFNPGLSDNNSISNEIPCIYYKIHGMNLDGIYSNFSNVYNICF